MSNRQRNDFTKLKSVNHHNFFGRVLIGTGAKTSSISPLSNIVRINLPYRSRVVNLYWLNSRKIDIGRQQISTNLPS